MMTPSPWQPSSGQMRFASLLASIFFFFCDIPFGLLGHCALTINFNSFLAFQEHVQERVEWTYSCTDPNCRDSPFEFDNSVILVGELLEKYTFSVNDYENYSSPL